MDCLKTGLCKYKYLLGLSLLIIFISADTEAAETVETVETVEVAEGIFSFIDKVPPPGFIYITFIIAFAAFSWKVIEFIVNRKDKKKERQAGLKSEYWFKYIIMPMCVTPLIDFVMQYADKLYIMDSERSGADEGINRDKYDAFLKEFKNEKSFITCRFLLLDSLGTEFYYNAVNTIDELDDIVTQHCFACSTGPVCGDDRHYDDVGIVKQNMTYKLNDILAELYKKYQDANNIT